MGNLTSIVNNNRQYVQPTGVNYADTAPKRNLVSPGWHWVTIEEAIIRDSKAGGKYVWLKLRTDDGDVLFDRINVLCESQTAVEIGMRALSAIAKANGRERFDDTSEMIGCRVSARVAIRHSDTYGDDNEVKAYSGNKDNKPARAGSKSFNDLRQVIRGNENRNQQAAFRSAEGPTGDEIPF